MSKKSIYIKLLIFIKCNFSIIKESISNGMFENLVLIYPITAIFIAIFLNILMPIILNYPPNYSEIAANSKLSYNGQFILILGSIIAIYSVIGIANIYTVRKWEKMIQILKRRKKLTTSRYINFSIKVENIKNMCVNIPYLMLFVQILIPVIVFIIVNSNFAVKTSFSTTSRSILIVLSSSALVGIISLPVVNRVFKEIILFVYDENTEKSIGIFSLIKGLFIRTVKKSLYIIKRILAFRIKFTSIKNTFFRKKFADIFTPKLNLNFKSFITILPILILIMTFISFLGYSKVIQEKGTLINKIYGLQIDSRSTQINSLENIDQVKKIFSEIIKQVNLKDIPSSILIAEPNIKKVDVSDNDMLSNVFIYNLFKNTSGYIQDESGAVQATIIRLKLNEINYIVGIKYIVSSSNTILDFVVISLILLILSTVVIHIFSNSIAQYINDVIKGLKEIEEQNNLNFDKPLHATSNDEIGDLVLAFNKIQRLEKQRVNEIKEYQEILLQRERLAIIGETAGGIAHDINNPLSAIEGCLTYLKNIVFPKINELSLDDKNKEFFKETETYLEGNIRTCKRAMKIVSSLKNSTRNLSGDYTEVFLISKVFEDLKILADSKLKITKCNLLISGFENIQISGDSNKLYRIISNIVMNSLDAYKFNDTFGNVEISLDLNKNSGLKIFIKDYAGGIPQKTRDNIFKKMLTTKGAEGTGLGLFVSKSLITGHFNGDLTYEVDDGKGTTFIIFIPLYKDNTQNIGGVL